MIRKTIEIIEKGKHIGNHSAVFPERKVKKTLDSVFFNQVLVPRGVPSTCDPSEKSPARISPQGAALTSGLSEKVHEDREKKGSGSWIPFASYCTTGRFSKLESGFRRHCGPTAAVNLILTLRRCQESRRPVDVPSAGNPGGFAAAEEKRAAGNAMASAGPGKNADDSAGRRAASGKESPEELFLLCTRIGRQTFAYWNMDVLGRIGGTSNFLTGIFLRRCLRAAGLGPGEARTAKRAEKNEAGGQAAEEAAGPAGFSVRFHPWITPDAVEKALARGQIVYLEVYRHPKYKNHHMLCYACRVENGTRKFLLADGWSPAPVWTEEKGLGHGHFLTVSCMS